MARQTGHLDLVAEFERAWADARHTRFVRSAEDVNEILGSRYETSEPLTFTRSMLWDVEVRKAAAPGVYIPYVVRQGSDRVWRREPLPDGGEFLARSSAQRLWLRPDDYGTVLEVAHLDHRQQKVTFLGVAELDDAAGRTIRAGTGQPLFHVEHSVGGTERRPLNLWRIVHLTGDVDERLIEHFSRTSESPWLPEFVEIYIQRDLGIGLTRREAG